MPLSRRNFLGSLIAAPAIVRASSLMRVVPIPDNVAYFDPSDVTTIVFDDPRTDPLYQLRIIGWKEYEIINPPFLARIETAAEWSAFNEGVPYRAS